MVTFAFSLNFTTPLSPKFTAVFESTHFTVLWIRRIPQHICLEAAEGGWFAHMVWTYAHTTVGPLRADLAEAERESWPLGLKLLLSNVLLTPEERVQNTQAEQGLRGPSQTLSSTENWLYREHTRQVLDHVSSRYAGPAPHCWTSPGCCDTAVPSGLCLLFVSTLLLIVIRSNYYSNLLCVTR